MFERSQKSAIKKGLPRQDEVGLDVAYFLA